MFPTPDLFDDGVRVGGPDERLRVFVVLLEEAVDGGLQIGDALEDPTLEPPLRQRGEEALDGVEPRGRGRREVEVKARMPRQPRPDFRVLVRGVVIDNEMQLSRPGSRG